MTPDLRTCTEDELKENMWRSLSLDMLWIYKDSLKLASPHHPITVLSNWARCVIKQIPTHPLSFMVLAASRGLQTTHPSFTTHLPKMFVPLGMLILKSRCLSSRWYKATSCSLARSSSDRFWIGTGCRRTLWPNMVAHVLFPWSERETDRLGRMVTPVDLYLFVDSLAVLWTCPQRPNNQNQVIQILCLKSCRNHRLTRTRQILHLLHQGLVQSFSRHTKMCL